MHGKKRPIHKSQRMIELTFECLQPLPHTFSGLHYAGVQDLNYVCVGGVKTWTSDHFIAGSLANQISTLSKTSCINPT